MQPGGTKTPGVATRTTVSDLTRQISPTVLRSFVCASRFARSLVSANARDTRVSFVQRSCGLARAIHRRAIGIGHMYNCLRVSEGSAI